MILGPDGKPARTLDDHVADLLEALIAKAALEVGDASETAHYYTAPALVDQHGHAFPRDERLSGDAMHWRVPMFCAGPA